MAKNQPPEQHLTWHVPPSRARVVYGIPVEVEADEASMAAFVRSLRESLWTPREHRWMPEILETIGAFPVEATSADGFDGVWIIGCELAVAPIEEGETNFNHHKNGVEPAFQPSTASLDAMLLSSYGILFDAFAWVYLQDLGQAAGKERAEKAGIKAFEAQRDVAANYLMSGGRSASLFEGVYCEASRAPDATSDAAQTVELGRGVALNADEAGWFSGVEVATCDAAEGYVPVIARYLTQRNKTEEEWQIIEARDALLDDLRQATGMHPGEFLLVVS